MGNNPLSVARACLQAYVDKDRAAIERLVGQDFRFTSPLDHALERPTYFERCWPNSVHMDGVDIIHAAERGEQAFIVYEARVSGGKRFRNCEVYTVRDGRLVSTEVYFGWTLPHEAPAGGFVESGS